MANLSQEFSEILLPGTIFITTTGTLGVFGNIIVIVLYCCKVEDENGDRYFIPFLAFIDMLGSISMTIFNAISNYFFFSYPSEICCKSLNFSQMFSGFLSASLLLVIAVQRYRKVCHADHGQLTLFWRRCSICLTVSISAFIMSPWLIFSGTFMTSVQFQGQNVTGTICKFVSHNVILHYHSIVFLYFGCIYTLTMVILVALVVLYALIALKLRKVFQKTGTECEPLCKETGENVDSSSKHTTNTDVRTWFNLMYATIVIVYIVSFVPSAMLLIVAYSHVNYLNLPKSALNAYLIFGRFVVINHFVNPFIYTCFDFKFRKALISVCQCKNKTHV